METVLQCMPYINTCFPMRKSLTKNTKILFFKSMSQVFKKNENKRKARNWKVEEKSYLNKCPCKVCDVRRALELII